MEIGCVMLLASGRTMDIVDIVAILAVCATAGCSGSSGNSGAPSGLTPPSIALSLPIAPGDSTSVGYGIWPFGVHGGGHSLDGHPGFDFEYRLGAPVYAVVDATVSNRLPDSNAPGQRETIQLRYPGVPVDYFIDYTNLMNVPASIQAGARVTRGQVVGTAGPMGLGAGPFNAGMIHFGLSDPNAFEQNIAPHSVSPDAYMTPEARAQLEAIWQTAAYVIEWCEPFLNNSRAHGFPMSRTWMIASGPAPSRIVAGCPTEFGATEYSFIGPDGATMETGAMVVGWAARPTTIDFVAASGSRRLGLYDIVGDTMRLVLGAPGASRPVSFSGASVYSTQK